MDSLDDFKAFVKKNPYLKEEVLNKKRTWQDIYENWVLKKEKGFEEKTNLETTKTPDNPKTDDTIQTILNYIKKINPDNVTKYVNSIQKILDLVSSISGKTSAKIDAKNTLDPLFDRRYDDWY